MVRRPARLMTERLRCVIVGLEQFDSGCDALSADSDHEQLACRRESGHTGLHDGSWSGPYVSSSGVAFHLRVWGNASALALQPPSPSPNSQGHNP